MEGRSLGPYLIESELGSGGMGRVYSARMQRAAAGLDAGTRVALKVVHPHLLETEGFFKRFLREAEIGRSIRHANVVRTLDCDAIGGSHFLVMEYVEGQTLRDLAEELGNVPEELCRQVAAGIATGLGAIHAAGVLHRDIKPENVLITPDHQIKVMDLGVARLAAESIRLSQTGAFVGSLQYAAPESFRDGGVGVDARADLHALGLVLYELACGASPYLADDVPKTVHKVLHEEPRRLGDANPQLSPFFEEVVHCLLEKDREKRFADADALLAVLDAGERGTWWSARVSALRAVSQRPLRRIRIPRETAVYGREDELAKLRGLFDTAASGEGQVVLIEGEAGIGKSRLIDELVSRLQRDGVDINFLFGSYPPSGAATASGAWSTAFREHFGDAGSAAYLGQTPLLVPAFDALLRGEPAPADSLALSGNSLGTCFVHATRGLAAERTTVVLIDDLHFAPENSLGLFTTLALAIPGHRVLLIGTMRPGIPDDWRASVTRLDQVTQMSIARMSPKHLAQLLADSFSSERLATELGHQIALKSDGNPFFVFEIIRGLRDGQFITRAADGSWVSTRVIDAIEIPSSVLDLVNARVADLTEQQRDLLDVASCWGFEFDPGLVGDVLGVPRIPLLKRLAQIEREHRLVRSTGRNYTFDHHQVQEALYNSMNVQLREEYHAANARALEGRVAATTDDEAPSGAMSVAICQQFLDGGRAADALRHLAGAQRHFSSSYLHAESVALAERVLAIPGLVRGTDRAELLLRIAGPEGPLDRLAWREQQEEAVREAARLVEVGDRHDLERSAAFTLGAVLLFTGRSSEAAAQFRRELELAAEAGDRDAELRVSVSLSAALCAEQRFPEAEAQCRHAISLGRDLGNRQCEARASGNLSLILWSLFRLAEAEEQGERNVALAADIGDPMSEIQAVGNLSAALYSQGRYRRAQALAERGLAISREIGDRTTEAMASGNLGLIHLSQGHFSAARVHQGRSLALSAEIGYSIGESRARGNLGSVLHALGELAPALECIRRHLEASGQSGDEVGEATAAQYLGFVLMSAGHLAQARDALTRALELSRKIAYRPVEARALLGLGRVRRETGDQSGAVRDLVEALAVGEAAWTHGLVAAASRELGVLLAASGDEEAGIRALERARELGDRNGHAGDSVLSRCELAVLRGGATNDAVAAFCKHGACLDCDELRAARLLLWQATGDPVHLAEAKRQLDEDLAKVPGEYHESMLKNVRVNREIVAAWEEHGPGIVPD